MANRRERTIAVPRQTGLPLRVPMPQKHQMQKLTAEKVSHDS